MLLVFGATMSIVANSGVALSDHQYRERHSQLLDFFTQNYHNVEHALADCFHQWVETIQHFFSGTPQQASKFRYDVTLVGFVNYADGVGRHPILFKKCLEDHVKLNFVSTRDIDPVVEDAQLGLPRLNPEDRQDVGGVSILTDIISDIAVKLYQKVPDSNVKIAYTMFESTAIPQNWVSILNRDFDMAVVPDQFLVQVYKDCGVQIPVFVLPLPVMLEDFLKHKPASKPHKPFTFGMSGGFWSRKNHMKVLEAFAQEFGNSQDVRLRLHGRFGQEDLIHALVDKIEEYGLDNVELIVNPYDEDNYLNFFKTLDCYVFLSMGEGFSITPREALACGIPCILTDNTAQTTICNSGAVRVVPANILVPAFYDVHYRNDFLRANLFSRSIQSTEIAEQNVWRSAMLGYQFDCDEMDARQAMRDVYTNYAKYRKAAKQGRQWVQQYLVKNLSQKYVSLVKPEAIILGPDNIIGDKQLMTNSQALYDKYLSIIGD